MNATKNQSEAAEGGSSSHDLLAVWMAVEKELPDDEITVLISDVEQDVSLGYRDGEVWRYQNGEECGDAVTHWMHLPPPATIADGHGSMWDARCEDCGGEMHVCRPGKAQCGQCG